MILRAAHRRLRFPSFFFFFLFYLPLSPPPSCLSLYKANLLLPRCPHQSRVSKFAMELASVDATNSKILSSFIRASVPKLFSTPRMRSDIVMIQRSPGSLNYVKDSSECASNNDDLEDLGDKGYKKVVDEVISSKQIVRRVYAGRRSPLDVVCVPIFSPSDEVIGALVCVASLEEIPFASSPSSSSSSVGTIDKKKKKRSKNSTKFSEESSIDKERKFSKSLTSEDELTLFCVASAISLAVSIGSKSLLTARLAVDDQVRRLYAQQSKATLASDCWRYVAEAACFLSEATEESEVCEVSSIVKKCCGGDSCRVFVYDDKGGKLWTEDGEVLDNGNARPTSVEGQRGDGDALSDEISKDAMVKSIEAGKMQRVIVPCDKDGTDGNVTVIACPAKSSTGEVLGVIVVSKHGYVDVSATSFAEAGEKVKFFEKECVETLEVISGVIGNALCRVKRASVEAVEKDERFRLASDEIEKMKRIADSRRAADEDRKASRIDEVDKLKLELSRCKRLVATLTKSKKTSDDRVKKYESQMKSYALKTEKALNGIKKSRENERERSNDIIKELKGQVEALVRQNNRILREK